MITRKWRGPRWRNITRSPRRRSLLMQVSNPRVRFDMPSCIAEILCTTNRILEDLVWEQG